VCGCGCCSEAARAVILFNLSWMQPGLGKSSVDLNDCLSRFTRDEILDGDNRPVSAYVLEGF
jgi:hypothetical protein